MSKPKHIGICLVIGNSFHNFNYTLLSTNMEKYVCIVCGWVYDPAVGDPDNGIKPGTPFAELPDEWVCPECGVGKDMFEPQK